MKARRSLFFLILWWSGSLSAETWRITEVADSGPGSLRSAMSEATAQPGPHLILLEYRGHLSLKSPLPSVAGDLTIAGATVDLPTIGFTGSNSMLSVVSGSLTLSNLSFSGSTVTKAPVIANAAALYIDRCRFSGNTTLQRATNGGVIHSAGRLEVRDSHFTGNRCFGWDGDTAPLIGSMPGTGHPGLGGSIHVAAGFAEIRNSEFRQNEVQGGGGAYISTWHGHGPAGPSSGGAVAVTGGAQARILECVFWNNLAMGNVPGGLASGGAVHTSDAELVVHRSLFLENGAMGSSNYIVSGGPAFGGALHIRHSDVRITDSEFRLNWAANPPGVPTIDILARGGGVLIEGTPAFVRGNRIVENGARTAADLGGPVRSGGGNIVGKPGGAAGLSIHDSLPSEIHSRNPRFEWVQPTTTLFKGLLPAEELGFYSLEGNRPLLLARFDRFGQNTSSRAIGVGDTGLVAFFHASNAVNLVLRPYGGFSFGDFAQQFTGTFIAVSSETAELHGAQYEGSGELDRIVEAYGTVFALSGGQSGKPQLTVIKEVPGASRFELSLGDAVYRNRYPPTARKWLDVTSDAQGNWFLTGLLETNFNYLGWTVPTNFVISLTASNTVRWIAEGAVAASWQRIYSSGDGLLLSSSLPSENPDGVSQWDFFDAAGARVWTKTLLFSPHPQVFDPARGIIYAAGSGFVPPFESAAADTWERGEQIIYALDERAEILWAARMFGGVSLTSMTLDEEGDLLVAGIRGGDVTFHNNIVVRDSSANISAGFIAKLNTRLGVINPASIRQTSGSVELSWPSAIKGILEHSGSLGNTAVWRSVPVINRGHYDTVTVTPTNASGFFRLTHE